MHWGGRAVAVALASAAVGVGTAVAAAPKAVDCQLVTRDAGPPGHAPIRVEVWTRGLRVPWSLAFLPGGDALVTERAGRLRYVTRDGRLSPAPVAELALPPGAEGGLLGLAVSPQYDETGDIFIYRTSASKDGALENRVERWRLGHDDRRVISKEVILAEIPAARFHDGGRLRFGPDHMLYVGTGDGGVPSRARDLASLGGKILRLAPDGAIPPDNPWPRSPAFVRGIRNTEGFDWLAPRTLYVTDNGPTGELGQHGQDEIDLAHAGEDLGWPVAIGCAAHAGTIAPSLTWAEAVPPGGALLYRGDAIPEWRGDLVVGTLASKHLHVIAFEPEAAGRVRSHEVYLDGDPPRGYGRLRDVVQGPDGAVYVTTSNCDGRGTCPAGGDAILKISE